MFQLDNSGNPLTALGQQQLDAFAGLLQQQLALWERLAAFNSATARDCWESQVASSRAVMAATTPEEALRLQAELAAPALPLLLGYLRGLHQIAQQARQDQAELLETESARFTQAFKNNINQAVSIFNSGKNK
jgi:phasin family protein